MCCEILTLAANVGTVINFVKIDQLCESPIGQETKLDSVSHIYIFSSELCINQMTNTSMIFVQNDKQD